MNAHILGQDLKGGYEQGYPGSMITSHLLYLENIRADLDTMGPLIMILTFRCVMVPNDM